MRKYKNDIVITKTAEEARNCRSKRDKMIKDLYKCPYCCETREFDFAQYLTDVLEHQYHEKTGVEVLCRLMSGILSFRKDRLKMRCNTCGTEWIRSVPEGYDEI